MLLANMRLTFEKCCCCDSSVLNECSAGVAFVGWDGAGFQVRDGSRSNITSKTPLIWYENDACYDLIAKKQSLLTFCIIHI